MFGAEGLILERFGDLAVPANAKRLDLLNNARIDRITFDWSRIVAERLEWIAALVRSHDRRAPRDQMPLPVQAVPKHGRPRFFLLVGSVVMNGVYLPSVLLVHVRSVDRGGIE